MRMRIEVAQEPNQFRKEVEERAQINLAHCMQCSKCGGACTNTDSFDLTPRQIIEATLDGLKDKVLKSRSMWMCAQCDQCQIECPAGISINKLMQTVRELALAENIEPNTEPYDREYIKEFYCPKNSGNWDIDFVDKDK